MTRRTIGSYSLKSSLYLPTRSNEKKVKSMLGNLNRVSVFCSNLLSVKQIRYNSTSFDVNLTLSEKLALEHIKNGKVTTHLIINKILSNQKVSIDANKLKALLEVEGVGVELTLPITEENMKTYTNLVGKSTYSGQIGVYVFAQKNSSLIYLGSSNLLKRRMEYYFKKDLPLVGKFPPLLRKEGLSSFTLTIYKLDKDTFKSQDALSLEKYMLLNKSCDLNILRVVNFGPSLSKTIYVYNTNYLTSASAGSRGFDVQIVAPASFKYPSLLFNYKRNYIIISFNYLLVSR